MENENMHNFKLIDGVFDYEQASEVLLSLIDRKINFHKLESFGHEIRCGEVLAQSQQRITDLTKCYSEIQDLIKSNATENQRFNIKATIQITPME